MSEREKEILKKVVEEMRTCNLFNGNFHKTGNVHFAYGVATVMEYLGRLISDEYADELTEEFFANLTKSIDNK